MFSLDNMTFEEIEQTLAEIVAVHTLLTGGLFPGGASAQLTQANAFLKNLHAPLFAKHQALIKERETEALAKMNPEPVEKKD